MQVLYGGSYDSGEFIVVKIVDTIPNRILLQVFNRKAFTIKILSFLIESESIVENYIKENFIGARILYRVSEETNTTSSS